MKGFEDVESRRGGGGVGRPRVKGVRGSSKDSACEGNPGGFVFRLLGLGTLGPNEPDNWGHIPSTATYSAE